MWEMRLNIVDWDYFKIQTLLATFEESKMNFRESPMYLWKPNSESGKRKLFARQLTPRERPKVTLRPSWVHERCNCVSMPRETESHLQTWDSNPNSSESRKWPKEDIELSIDLRIEGIPNETLTQMEMVRRGEANPRFLNSTQWHHLKSTEEHASGNREAFTDDDRCKANLWTTSWW